MTVIDHCLDMADELSQISVIDLDIAIERATYERRFGDALLMLIELSERARRNLNGPHTLPHDLTERTKRTTVAVRIAHLVAWAPVLDAAGAPAQAGGGGAGGGGADGTAGVALTEGTQRPPALRPPRQPGGAPARGGAGEGKSQLQRRLDRLAGSRTGKAPPPSPPRKEDR